MTTSSAPQRHKPLAAACLLALTALPAQAAPLGNSTGMYPRLVRMATGTKPPLIASVTAFDNGAHADIFRSDDDGATFIKAGEVRDPDFNSGLCCGGLYALPVAIGKLKAGTLLYAGSVGQGVDDKPMQLKIYRSEDQGRTWTYLSNCYTAPVNRKGGGLWEVEFLITKKGQLACLFSDETVPGHSQILQQSLSSDGVHWSKPTTIVQLDPPADRPGMPVVAKLADGRFFMTYEICGPAHNCDVFHRSSKDGINWGNPAEIGTPLATPEGLTLRATPTVTLVSDRLVVTGQRVYKNGVHQPDVGATVFVDDSGTGNGPWRALPAPVEVRNIPADGNVCQNYSSPLLPSRDGKSLIALASDFAEGQCQAKSGTMPLP